MAHLDSLKLVTIVFARIDIQAGVPPTHRRSPLKLNQETFPTKNLFLDVSVCSYHINVPTVQTQPFSEEKKQELCPCTLPLIIGVVIAAHFVNDYQVANMKGGPRCSDQ